MRKQSFLSTSRAIWVIGQDFRCSAASIINMVLHKNEFRDEFWKFRLPMKSGVLPWEKVYLFSKRSSRAAWYGGMNTKEKISNHDLIWSNKNDLWGTKKGKMWFASMGKKRPWPTWKCWLLMKKGNPKENKKILMSLPQTILCRAQLPWQWGAEPYSGWWQARQPFPHSKCRGRCSWQWPWFATTTQPTCPTLIFA